MANDHDGNPGGQQKSPEELEREERMRLAMIVSQISRALTTLCHQVLTHTRRSWAFIALMSFPWRTPTKPLTTIAILASRS